jgi:hypothetical protein
MREDRELVEADFTANSDLAGKFFAAWTLFRQETDHISPRLQYGRL